MQYTCPPRKYFVFSRQSHSATICNGTPFLCFIFVKLDSIVLIFNETREKEPPEGPGGPPNRLQTHWGCLCPKIAQSAQALLDTARYKKDHGLLFLRRGKGCRHHHPETFRCLPDVLMNPHTQSAQDVLFCLVDTQKLQWQRDLGLIFAKQAKMYFHAQNMHTKTFLLLFKAHPACAHS